MENDVTLLKRANVGSFVLGNQVLDQGNIKYHTRSNLVALVT